MENELVADGIELGACLDQVFSRQTPDLVVIEAMNSNRIWLMLLQVRDVGKARYNLVRS